MSLEPFAYELVNCLNNEESRTFTGPPRITAEEVFEAQFNSLPEPGEIRWPADWGDVGDGEIPVDPHYDFGYDFGTCPHCGERLDEI